MTTSLGQTVLMNALSPVRVVAASNVAGTYSNGPSNNGVGATLTIASSSLTVDGVVLALRNRVLLSNQTLPAQNGIYIVKEIGSTVVLQRADDQQSIEQLKAGQFTVVGAGSAAGSVYALAEPLPQVIGADGFNYVGTSLVANASLTAAQFNAMYTTPVELLSAPGANKLIVVDRMELVETYVSAAYAAGGIVGAQYGSTANGAGPLATNTEAAASFQATASTTYLFNGATGAKPFATTVNQGLFLSNATAVFTTGDSPFDVKVHYHIIDVA